MTEVLGNSFVADVLAEAVVKKVSDVSMPIFIIRSHTGIEFLISRWNMETYTFVTSWGEFSPTLEDVSVMFNLSVSA